MMSNCCWLRHYELQTRSMGQAALGSHDFNDAASEGLLCLMWQNWGVTDKQAGKDKGEKRDREVKRWKNGKLARKTS